MPRFHIAAARRGYGPIDLVASLPGWGLAATMALVAPAASAHVAAQKSSPASTCAALASEIDGLNARITAHSGALDAATNAVLAEQAARRQVLDKQRNAGAQRALVGSVLGSFVPGADLVTAIAGHAAGGSQPASPLPSSTDLNGVLAGSSALGAQAVQAGKLMAQFDAAGCRSILKEQQP